MVRVKICGITNVKDALIAVECGAWAVGFIFYKKSPRYISPPEVKTIVEQLPPFVTPVGVFVNESEENVRHVAQVCYLRTLQFHGEETADFCSRFKRFKVIKTFHIHDQFQWQDTSAYKVSAFLFDTFCKDVYGGSGQAFNWNTIKGHVNRRTPIILSGGLNSQNVKLAVSRIKPFAIDVSSGVEARPGKKSEDKLQSFFGALTRI